MKLLSLFSLIGTAQVLGFRTQSLWDCRTGFRLQETAMRLVRVDSRQNVTEDWSQIDFHLQNLILQIFLSTKLHTEY